MGLETRPGHSRLFSRTVALIGGAKEKTLVLGGIRFFFVERNYAMLLFAR